MRYGPHPLYTRMCLYLVLLQSWQVTMVTLHSSAAAIMTATTDHHLYH